MKRVLTATCLAAAFAVGLSAQSTATSGSTAQDPQTTTAGQGRGGPRTATGCLREGDTAGTYMLTDVTMQGGGRRGGMGGGAAAGGTTAGSTTTGSTAGTMPQGGRGMGPQSVMLTADSSVDLKAHVGHKVEVTGTMTGGRGRMGNAGDTSGAAATGTSTAGGGQGMGRGAMRSMTVTSIRMVADSCS